MYKLFLCLRYLRRRYVAWIGALAVWLCVFMVLVVVSVFDGFLHKVEVAARGLFGEIIVDATSLSDIGRYNEFVAELTGELRVEAEFAPAKPTGDGKYVYAGAASDAVIEALAEKTVVATVEETTDPTLPPTPVKRLRPAGPRTLPARATILADGRPHGELSGELTLATDGKLTFVASPAAGSDGLPADLAATRLGDVVATVGKPMPEVEAATPVIYSYGLLRIGESFTTPVQICGIRLPERNRVTDFEKGMFVQTGEPDADFRPPVAAVLEHTRTHIQGIRRLLAAEGAKRPDRQDAGLIARLNNALGNAPGEIISIDMLLTDLAAERAKPPVLRDERKIELLEGILAESRQRLAETFARRFASGRDPVILGVGISGLSFRAPSGEVVRAVTPGQEIVLTLLPLGRGSLSTAVTPNTRTFVVVDDVKTDVYPIDSKTVYVPFDALQDLADMGERRDIDDPKRVTPPAQCSQIQVKVRAGHESGARLIAVRQKVQSAWMDFHARHPEASAGHVVVQTWREKLADFIGPIEKQRMLVVLMFAVISFVSVLLIFAIFYMIVMQKVHDIGVIRAVGGSSPGVAAIFLGFGAATGLIGSAIGLLTGWLFVHYINEIHDWVASLNPDWRVFSPESYLFERIPNEVDPGVALVIVLWAITSGLIGALIPAIRAAIMEPAEAVRYE